MIKFAIMSDLHVEFDENILNLAQKQLGYGLSDRRAAVWWQHLKEREASVAHPWLGPDLWRAKGADLFILAGDVHLGENAVEWANEAARFCGCTAVLVPGNHEFYGSEMSACLERLRGLAARTDGRVRLLDRDRADFVFGGRRLAVLGTTLWTDWCLNGESQRDKAMRAAGHGLNDHRAIRKGGGHFLPQDALVLHWESREWLAAEIPKAKGEADIVLIVTHHAVTPLANPPEYRGGALSPAFVSNMEDEVGAWAPDMWVTGHTHFSLDVVVGATRVLSSQRGYVGVEDGAEKYLPLIVEL